MEKRAPRTAHDCRHESSLRRRLCGLIGRMQRSSTTGPSGGRRPGGIDPLEAYRKARKQTLAMRRYSTRQGEFVPYVKGRSSVGRTGSGASRAARSWEWLGPSNIGGRTRTLVIHPQKPRIMYAGGVSGGVWKTTTSGRKWRTVGDEMANLAVNAMAMDPSNPRVLYVGTGEGYFREVVRVTGLPLRGAVPPGA